MARDSFPFDEIDAFFNSLRRRWQQNIPSSSLTSNLTSQHVTNSSTFRDIDSSLSSFPRIGDRRIDYFRPSLDFNSDSALNATSLGLTESTKNPGKYEVDIPLSNGIGPEDLKVTLKDHMMTIEAKKESKSEDGTRKTYLEFKRQFTLPPNVNMAEVKSVLTSEGHLKIEAPIPPPPKPQQPALTAPPKETPIPIRAE
jgi:HSP20 family molecular chaperone IbpA